MKRSIIVLTAVLFVLTMVSGAVAERKPVTPTAKEKCPVCGMFVAKYPDMIAEVIFRDGPHAVFDGCKDMFRYYFNIRKYNPSKTVSDIDSIYVTEYYNLAFIDGRKAYYVVGSDVLGPMGRELIPFLKADDASAFRKDHGGEILRFGEVTEAVVKGLE